MGKARRAKKREKDLREGVSISDNFQCRGYQQACGYIYFRKCLAVHLKFKATKALRRVINIYQSSENLKLLITEENNSDYLIIVQGYAGIYWILASMRILICHLPPLHNSSDLPSNAKTAQEQLKEPSKETRMFNQNSKSTYLNWIEHPLDYPYLTMLYL